MPIRFDHRTHLDILLSLQTAQSSHTASSLSFIFCTSFGRLQTHTITKSHWSNATGERQGISHNTRNFCPRQRLLLCSKVANTHCLSVALKDIAQTDIHSGVDVFREAGVCRCSCSISLRQPLVCIAHSRTRVTLASSWVRWHKWTKVRSEKRISQISSSRLYFFSPLFLLCHHRCKTPFMMTRIVLMNEWTNEGITYIMCKWSWRCRRGVSVYDCWQSARQGTKKKV